MHLIPTQKFGASSHLATFNLIVVPHSPLHHVDPRPRPRGLRGGGDGRAAGDAHARAVGARDERLDVRRQAERAGQARKAGEGEWEVTR